MKNTKLIALFCCMLAMICSIGFTSCEDHEEEYKAGIVGYWMLKSAINYEDGKGVENMPLFGTNIIEFREDNNYNGSIYGTDLQSIGKWSIVNNTLTLTDINHNTLSFTMSIQGDELTIYDIEYIDGHSYKTEYIFMRM